DKQDTAYLSRREYDLYLKYSLFFNVGFHYSLSVGYAEGRHQPNLIADNIASSLIFQDERSANATLSSLRRDSTVRYACLIDIDGKLFAQFERSPGDSVQLSVPLIEYGVHLGEQYVEVLRPVILNDTVIGTVFIRSDLTDFRKKIVQYGYIVIAVFFLSLFLAGILSQRFQKLITGPIQQLVTLAKDISIEEDYTKRLDLKRDDELGTLIDGFNSMLSVIEDRERRLHEHTEHLEHLVHIRSEQLHKQAYFDSLTELPNRNMLLDRLNQEIARSKRGHESFALLFLDLDRFKTINDTLGHHVGDQLLRAIAERLAVTVRKEDMVGRLGGDEFVMLLTNITTQKSLEIIAESILVLFSKPFELSQSSTTLHVTASIGICLYPQDGDDVETLMRNADASMYEAKANGPGHYFFYRKGINAASHRQLAIENQLRHALTGNEFHLCYQPQVRLEDETLIGTEALIRWSNKNLGKVFPNEFIPLAEEIGIINEIGEWVVEEACSQNKKWQISGYPPIIIAVNISASHLLTANFVSKVKDILEKTQLEPRYLEIEITEDMFLDNSDRIMGNLMQLKDIGVRIAIDDFGTGYSSLSYLQSFPVDILKLDGTFIKEIGKNKTSEDIVSATINLVHSLGLKMVAEAVETKMQWDFLIKHGCDYVQGHYFSRPLTVTEVKHFFKKPRKKKVYAL
ncbi:MAG: EAL domain-containing protein, partial [Gammaproteobacteria bacterium]